MALSAAVIDAMVAAGCTAEQLGAAVKADLAEQESRREAKRANNAERQRRFKAKRKAETQSNAGNALPTVTTLDKEVSPQTPLQEINPKSPPIVPPKRKSAPPAKPDDVSEQTWADWLALRRAKRAPVSPRVVDGARQEAAKLGWTLEAFLTEWVMRGSQGLSADWIKPRNTGPPGSRDDYLAHFQTKKPLQGAIP